MSLTYGIDVDHWQGVVNWPLVAVQCPFAYCKATEGTGYRDPMFPTNWRGMRGARMLRGCYHFARISHVGTKATLQRGARDEADWYLEVIGSDRADALPPVLVIGWDRRARKTSTEYLLEWALAWLEQVESKTGLLPIVYTSRNYWRWRLLKSDALFRYPLWLAQCKRKGQGPKSPIPGWTWEFWQFSKTKRVQGVQTPCAVNAFEGQRSRLRNFMGEAAYQNRPPVTEIHWAEPTLASRMICPVVDWCSSKPV